MSLLNDNQNEFNMLLMKEIGTLYQKIRDLEAGMLTLNDEVAKLKSKQEDSNSTVDNVFIAKDRM